MFVAPGDENCISQFKFGTGKVVIDKLVVQLVSGTLLEVQILKYYIIFNLRGTLLEVRYLREYYIPYS